jgi:ribosomal protein L23
MKSLVLKPRQSEKSYALSQKINTYAFDVPVGFNSQQIAQMVKTNFDVKVKAVRIAGVKGKSQKSYRRQGRVVHRGQRSDVRKAYVILEKGEKLPIFAAVEDAGKKPDPSTSSGQGRKK